MIFHLQKTKEFPMNKIFFFAITVFCPVSFGQINPPPVEFIRGDSNEDGVVTIHDSNDILCRLFSQCNPIHTCPAAMDANGDGQINLTDPIFINLFLFNEGQAIPYPYPDCDFQLPNDPVPCNLHGACD